MALVAVGIATPVAEELWFRGVVLRGTLARHPQRRAFLLSALLFGLAHADPYRIVSHTLVGWVFGRWAALTGSLVPSMLGHLALNLAIVAALHEAPPDPSAIGAGGWSLEVVVLDVCGAATGAAFVVVGLRWMGRLAPGAMSAATRAAGLRPPSGRAASAGSGSARCRRPRTPGTAAPRPLPEDPPARA